MPVTDEDFRRAIALGDVARVRDALVLSPERANRTIRWYLNQANESDPLHFVADCVGNGWLNNQKDGELVALLLEYGADIEGSKGREPPLVASASLGAERASKVLIESGANIEAASLHNARALHWAAWMGSSATVELLLARQAQIEIRDAEFGAAPLFWAVHGLGPDGPQRKCDQLGCVRLLLSAGVDANTVNKQGISARELAECYPDRRLLALFDEYK